ncbi:PAS-domain containing protein [Stappia sp. ES.058]|uniref:sensor histidine kinase n=1 Tax=Stappia sp. ES.058 TaxID=1881061 RepID=UPI000879B3D6|nr:PAS-domain containing protein [Stappia sp. ES.058]SDU15536.1 Signal transduction histidine kinase [Stappia sp. ES.058]
MRHHVASRSAASPLLDHLLNSVHQGITVFDADLRLVLANDTALQMLGVPAGLLQDMPTMEQLLRFNAERGDYGPGDREEQIRSRLELAASQEAHDFERTRPDGTILRIQGTPMADGGFVTLYSDVTELRRQERELAASHVRLEERLEARTAELRKEHDMLVNAVNAVRDGLVIVDRNGRIVLANETFERLFPYRDDFGRQDADILPVLHRYGPCGLVEALEGIDSDPETPSEFQFRTGAWYRVSRRPTGDDGTITYKFTDITTFKKQHRTLQRHTDKLVKMLRHEQEVNEMQREFVSMASHEFRTPLAIIDSNAQRLLRRLQVARNRVDGAPPDPDTQIERLGHIRESVDRMQYLINRFLRFSKGQSGALEIEPVDAPLRELVETVCTRQMRVCATHKIDVDLAGLPEMSRIDTSLIEQCVDNVVSNAIKYSPAGERIHVRGDVEGRFAVVRVTDCGVGIPANEIPKICNRYYRATTASGIAGTGIGLHMANMIVTGHGGKLVVSSKVGDGTTVEIHLPVAQNVNEVSESSKAAS